MNDKYLNINLSSPEGDKFGGKDEYASTIPTKKQYFLIFFPKIFQFIFQSLKPKYDCSVNSYLVQHE